MSRLIKIIVLAGNMAIFIALLIWLYGNVSFDAVLVHLAAMPLATVLTASALNIVLLLVYGWRLARLLEWQFLPSLATATLGFGLNGILPFRLGDLAKIAYANRLFAIPPASLAATTAVEKLLDLGALALLGLWSMQSQGGKFVFANGVVVTILLLFLGGLSFLSAGLWGLTRWRHALGGRPVWVFTAVDLLVRKGNPRTLIALVLSTAMIWLITVAMIFMIFAGMFNQFGISNAAILSLIIALAIVVPSAPAGLGIVEAGIVGYLHQVLGADPNQALAAALAFHFVTSFPQVLAAVAIMGWNLSLTVSLRSDSAH
jgi:hypothetical protein